MKTRTNFDIKGIMIHHSKDVDMVSGEVLNKEFNTTPNYFGSPYDIFINRNGSVDLTPRWILAVSKLQYLKDVPPFRILSYGKHYYAGIGETEPMKKDYVHIALSGDFDVQDPLKVQINSLFNVLREVIRGLHINPRTHLIYHGDISNTSCPGFKFVEKSYLIDKVRDSFTPI